ncbi:MAG: glycosyltransferase [Candidatus Saccharicenans sp.]
MTYAIAQFNDTFPPLMDGVAVVVWNYASWLHHNFGTCYVVVPRIPESRRLKPRFGQEWLAGRAEKTEKAAEAEEVEKEGKAEKAGKVCTQADFPIIRYFSMPLPFRYPYRIGLPWLDWRFLRELDRLNFNLVHAHNPFSAGMIARKYARKHHVPIVATFHSSIHEFIDRLLHSRVATREIVRKVADYYDSVDSVWVSSDFTGNILKEYGCRKEPVVIPHGVDLLPRQEPEVEWAEGNRVLGTAVGDKVLLYVGYLSHEKNLCFLIRALGKVKKMGLNFKMFFVGEGYARPQLEELVRNLELTDEVRFVGLIRERELLRLYYARADLFLFPSVNDTYAMVIREAAAFKVPSVVVEGTAVAAAIKDSEDGFVTERNPEGYAEKIAFLLRNPEKIKRAGEGAFRQLYIPCDKVMGKVAELYKQIMKIGTP